MQAPISESTSRGSVNSWFLLGNVPGAARRSRLLLMKALASDGNSEKEWRRLPFSR
jgi:hypothetical protein